MSGRADVQSSCRAGGVKGERRGARANPSRVLEIMERTDPTATEGAPAGPPAGRIPDFFIVGHPKCGTTALYQMLMHHPQIYLPESKEPWFFASELLTRTLPRPTGTPQTLEEYVTWFKDAREDQIVGEASPFYLWSRVAAGNIAAVQPDAKIIAILREPASFLRSLHMELVKIYVEPEPDLRRALELEPERREGRHIGRYSFWPQMLAYSDYITYVEQLERFRAVFPPEQILLFIYDDFRADNDATLASLLDFLGADARPLPRREANTAKRVRSRAMHELVHAVSVGHGPVSQAIKGSIKAVTSHSVRRRALRAAQKGLVFAEPEPPDEELMREIRLRYRPEVEALSRYLGRDFITLWGYDRLD